MIFIFFSEGEVILYVESKGGEDEVEVWVKWWNFGIF